MRALLSILALALAAPSLSQTPLLTEFLANNDTGLMDEDGDRSDWIELHNPSGAPVDLTGWTLTDDAGNPAKWTFPATTLTPGSYLVVFASDKDRAVSGSELHTNFRLSAGGEYLGLINPSGTVITAFAPTYPPQVADISYGFEADFFTRSYFDPPTPGAPNQPGGQLLEAVGLSRAHGLVDNAFNLTLSHPSPTATIRYTLDGREPTPTDTAYAGPFAITSTTTLRARAFAPGFLPSEISTATWIFPGTVVAQDAATAAARGLPPSWIDINGNDWTLGGTRPGAWYGIDTLVTTPFPPQQIRQSLRSIPTLSVVMHSDDLFGYLAPSGRDGIYPNSTLEDPAWERACSLEWIDPSGGPDFTITCGTNIQGGSSTSAVLRNQLSLALKFRADYGPTKLDFQVFPDSPVDEFDYLVVDSGNQLSINGSAGTSTKIRAQELRDQFAADLHEDMGHPTPHGRSIHLYLNGMYWGVFNLHERPDERFAAALDGNEPEQYDWIKRGNVLEGNSNGVNSATPGIWAEVRDIVMGGVAPGSTWRGMDAYTALSERVDLTNYVDYLLMNWYCGNTDWPQNNWMATVHARNSANFADVNPDGRIRFQSWDAEAALYWGGAVTAVNDGFYDRTGITSGSSASAVFIHTAARQHPDYITLIGDRYQRHALTAGGALWVEQGYRAIGTPYDPMNPQRNVPATRYYDRAIDVGPAIVMEYARWGNYFHSPGRFTPADWLTERNRLLTDFFPIRSTVLGQQLVAATPQLYPSLSAPGVSRASGRYPLGSSVNLGGSGGATIYYTLDGTDPRLSLGAVNPAAQTFSGPFQLTRGVTRLRARAFNGSEWSALIERDYMAGFRVWINEVQSDNQSTILDEVGQLEDWFEIHNPTTETLDLSGFHLSDDADEPLKWQVPAGVTVAPGGHLLFWADDDEDQGNTHTNFRLSSGGETLILSGPSGLEDVVVHELVFPALRSDQSYRRVFRNGQRFGVSPNPTPGTTNLPGNGMPR
ncbi:MAG: lamin tail domain-containing protein [Planctomycetota bacterium]